MPDIFRPREPERENTLYCNYSTVLEKTHLEFINRFPKGERARFCRWLIDHYEPYKEFMKEKNAKTDS